MKTINPSPAPSSTQEHPDLQIRSFIAREQGDYYFNGLATDVDYELTAEANGQGSATKILSLFDTHPEARMNLQLKK